MRDIVLTIKKERLKECYHSLEIDEELLSELQKCYNIFPEHRERILETTKLTMECMDKTRSEIEDIKEFNSWGQK